MRNGHEMYWEFTAWMGSGARHARYCHRSTFKWPHGRPDMRSRIGLTCGSGDQRRYSIVLIRLAQSSTLANRFAPCLAGFGP